MNQYSIRWIVDGEEGRLGEEEDYRKRRFFPTRVEAEHEAAFMKAIHPDREIIIQEFEEISDAQGDEKGPEKGS